MPMRRVITKNSGLSVVKAIFSVKKAQDMIQRGVNYGLGTTPTACNSLWQLGVVVPFVLLHNSLMVFFALIKHHKAIKRQERYFNSVKQPSVNIIKKLSCLD